MFIWGQFKIVKYYFIRDKYITNLKKEETMFDCNGLKERFLNQHKYFHII